MKQARYEVVDAETGEFIDVFWDLKEAREYLGPGEKIRVVTDDGTT